MRTYVRRTSTYRTVHSTRIELNSTHLLLYVKKSSFSYSYRAGKGHDASTLLITVRVARFTCSSPLSFSDNRSLVSPVRVQYVTSLKIAFNECFITFCLLDTLQLSTAMVLFRSIFYCFCPQYLRLSVCSLLNPSLFPFLIFPFSFHK